MRPGWHANEAYELVAAQPFDWRENAACRGHDSNWWFREGTNKAALRQELQALEICRRCPVQLECLEFALAAKQHKGIWGGMTEVQRRAIRRMRARAEAANDNA